MSNGIAGGQPLTTIFDEQGYTQSISSSQEDIKSTMDEKDVERGALEPEILSDAPQITTPEEVHASSEKDIERHPTAQQHETEKAESVHRIQTAQDWTGPDDEANPLTWSLKRKSWQLFILSTTAWLVTFTTSIYTPSVFQVEHYFHTTLDASILGLTLFTLGLAFGPALAAPISETMGRHVVYSTSLPIFGLFVLGGALTNTLAGLLICRFLAGLAGGPVLAVGAGSMADMFALHRRATASGIFLSMAFLGPATGPIVGGFVAQYKIWRWTGYVTLFVTLPLMLATIFTTRETYKKVILKRRAKKLNLAPPANQLKGLAAVKFLIRVTLIRPVHMLFTEPIVLFLALYTGFVFAVLFTFFAAFPYVFEGVYGFNTWQTGLSFVGLGVGVILGLITFLTLNEVVYRRKYLAAVAAGVNVVAPEHRLYAALAGSIALPISLFWFAWTARPDVHWISPVIASVFFGFGNMANFGSCALYLVDTYGPMNGASAMAANGLVRYTLGATFPLFTVQMYKKLTIAWATSLMGFVALALLPIPWVLFRFGPRIRGRSRYETIKA